MLESLFNPESNQARRAAEAAAVNAARAESQRKTHIQAETVPTEPEDVFSEISQEEAEAELREFAKVGQKPKGAMDKLREWLSGPKN